MNYRNMFGKFTKYIIHFLICTTLISNSAYWALGDISCLAPQDTLFSIAKEFGDEASSLSIVKSTIRWGITSNKELEESIWKALTNDRYEKLFEIGYFNGKRCLIFNGARYIFSQDSPVIYRFSDKKDIDDPFGEIIKKYRRQVTTRKIDGKLYYRQSFIVTEENLEFVNSCIQTLYPELAHTYGIDHQVLRLLQTGIFPENYKERWNLLGVRIREFVENRLNLKFEKPKWTRGAIGDSYNAFSLETIEESIRSVFVENRDRFMTNLLAGLNISRGDIYLVTFKPINEGLCNVIYEVDIELKDGILRRFCLVVSRSDRTPKPFKMDMGYLNPNEATGEDYKNLSFMYSVDSNYLPKPICFGKAKYGVNMFAVEFLEGYEEINRETGIGPSGFHINWIKSEPIGFEELSEEKKKDILLDEETSRELRIKMIGILANYFFRTHNKKARKGKLIDMVNINAGDFVYSKKDGSLKIITVRRLKDVTIEEFIDYIFNHRYYSDYPNLPPMYYLYEDADEVFSGVLMGLRNIYEKRKAKGRVIRYFRRYFMAIENGKFKSPPDYLDFGYAHLNSMLMAWLKREVDRLPVELRTQSLFPTKEEAMGFLKKNNWNLPMFRNWVWQRIGSNNIALADIVKTIGIADELKKKILEEYHLRIGVIKAINHRFGFSDSNREGITRIARGLGLELKGLSVDGRIFLRGIRMDKKKLIALLESLNWKLPVFRKEVLERAGLKSTGSITYGGFLSILGIDKIVKKRILKVYMEKDCSLLPIVRHFGFTTPKDPGWVSLVKGLGIDLKEIHLEKGYLLRVFKLDKKEVLRLIREEYKWNLPAMRERFLPGYKGRYKNYGRMLWGLDIEKEFETEFLKRFQKSLYSWNRTSRTFGVTVKTVYALVRRLRIQISTSPKDDIYVATRMDEKEVRELFEKYNWNLGRIMNIIRERLGCKKIVYADIITAFGMKEEFIRRFREVYLGNGKVFGITASFFGMEFHNFEKLLKRLGIDHRKIDEPGNFSGIVSRDKAITLLNITSWNLAILKEELFKRTKCQQITYPDLIRALGIEGEFRVEIVKRILIHNGSIGMLERAFGVNRKAVKRLLRSFGIAIRKDEIVRFKNWLSAKRITFLGDIEPFLRYLISEYNENFHIPYKADRCIELLRIIEAVGVFNKDIKALLTKSFVHSRQDLTSYAIQVYMGFMARFSGEFLLDKDKPGKLIGYAPAPQNLERALKKIVEKYGPGIIVPVDGIKLESEIPPREVVLDGRWIKISSEVIRDKEGLFSVLENGFLKRLLIILIGDDDKMRDALTVYNDLIMARNAVKPKKRRDLEWKVKLILSGLSPGQLRFITVIRDYSELPSILNRTQPMYMRFFIEDIDSECLSTIRELMKYGKDGIRYSEVISPENRLFLFSFCSNSGMDVGEWLEGHKLRQDNIEGIEMGITLLPPNRLKDEEMAPKDKRYLVLPYSRKSIIMAVDLILNYKNLENSGVYKVIKVLYKELKGEEPTRDDILRLIRSPWLVLPDPTSLMEFFNGIDRAREILMISA